jgi:phospholipid N-methyltransferase
MSWQFFKSYLTRPKEVGAIWPSSPQLCRGLVSNLDWNHAEFVAELGPGTGVVTPHILTKLNPQARFFSLEKNPQFCSILRRNHPNLDVAEGSVEQLASFCHERDFPRLDIVISSLPWASFSDSLQLRCLDALCELLQPSGEFSTFAYTQLLFLPAARKFRSRLNQRFSHVTTTPTFWRNLPPALVYQCRC